MKRLVCLFFAVSVLSCGTKDSERASTSEDGVTSGVAGFDPEDFQEMKLPLAVDTNLILSADSVSGISYSELRSMQAQYLASEFPRSAEHEINTFCMIDSLKRHKGYDAYLESLDIGMTKNSIAFRIGTMPLGKAGRIFLWGIRSSSFEACPFFESTTVVGTLVNAQSQAMHIVLGMRASGGDPPAMGTEEISSLIEESRIRIQGTSVSDDLDVPGEEVTAQQVTLEFFPKLRFVSPVKKVTNTEAVSN